MNHARTLKYTLPEHGIIKVLNFIFDGDEIDLDMYDYDIKDTELNKPIRFDSVIKPSDVYQVTELKPLLGGWAGDNKPRYEVMDSIRDFHNHSVKFAERFCLTHREMIDIVTYCDDEESFNDYLNSINYHERMSNRTKVLMGLMEKHND